MVKYLSISFLFLFMQTAYGYDLGFYRNNTVGVKQAKLRNKIQTSEVLAKERVDHLRLLLGTANIHFLELEQKTGPFAFTFSNILEHERSGSYLFKQTFDKAITALREDATNGMPLVFDPADSPEDRETKLHQHIMEVFKKTIREMLGNNAAESELASRTLNDYWNTFIQDSFEDEDSKKGYDQRTRPNLDQIDDNTKAMVATIQKYISNANHFFVCKRTCEETLGTLYQVDVIDGVVTKLRFKLPGTSATQKESLSLTLISLINFRTNRDNYFLDALSLFLEYVTPQITKDLARQQELKNEEEKLSEEQRKDFRATHKDELKILSKHIKAEEMIRHKKAGVLTVNQTLAKLTDLQLDFLIDLMLQLRGTDTPVPEDVGALSRYLGKFKLDETGRVKIKEEKAAFSLAKRDYEFYTALNDELYNLEEFLSEEIRTEGALDKLLQKEHREKEK